MSQEKITVSNQRKSSQRRWRGVLWKSTRRLRIAGTRNQMTAVRRHVVVWDRLGRETRTFVLIHLQGKKPSINTSRFEWKWPPFCKRHFEMHILKGKCLYFLFKCYWSFNFVTKDPIVNKLAQVQVMACCPTGKPLLKPVSVYGTFRPQWVNSFFLVSAAWIWVMVFTRGQFWPSGIVVACVCLSVWPSVRLCVR